MVPEGGKRVTVGPETLSAAAGEGVAHAERVVGDTDEGIKSEMEPLVRAGRLRDATAALKRWARAGAPQWEIYIWLGRIAEEKGCLGEAERFYCMALRANPARASLEIDIARFPPGRLEAAAALLPCAREPAVSLSEAYLARARMVGKSGRSHEADEILRDGAIRMFSALLCARRYRAAFQLGEAMLKKPGRIKNTSFFLWPWWHKVSSRPSETQRRFCVQELERIRRAGRKGGFPPWFAYCRGVLLANIGNKEKEVLAEYELIRKFRSARYSCLHPPFVITKLMRGDFEETIEICRGILKKVPEYWWFHCRMAEAYMANGAPAVGLREFERAQQSASDVFVRQAIMTWHGEALLWMGDYRKALEKFDETVGGGTKTWINCWRGAAYLKLGDHGKAMADLDRAIELDPQDLEAHVWRGEAYRLLGRQAEALRDLDRAIGFDSYYCWGYFNRALVRHALGDEAGMAADFSAIPREVPAFIRGKLGMPKDKALSPAEMRKVLMAGLEWAKGVRRPENYLNRIWMGCWHPREARLFMRKYD